MKNIVITGASQGIGRAISKTLSHKYNLIAIDIQMPEHHFCKDFFQCDLGNSEQLKSTIESIQTKISSLYGLVNNAGIFTNKPLAEQSLEEWEKIIAVNLRAPYLLSQAFAPLLSASKGHIINIASIRSIMSELGTEAYSASKGGLASLTHALSMSLSGKVSVNSISPGWINTDENYIPSLQEHAWHPSGRVGRPSDIAELVAFLLERNDGFITGSDFVVDGGVSRKMVYP